MHRCFQLQEPATAAGVTDLLPQVEGDGRSSTSLGCLCDSTQTWEEGKIGFSEALCTDEAMDGLQGSGISPCMREEGQFGWICILCIGFVVGSLPLPRLPGLGYSEALLVIAGSTCEALISMSGADMDRGWLLVLWFALLSLGSSHEPGSLCIIVTSLLLHLCSFMHLCLHLLLHTKRVLSEQD